MNPDDIPELLLEDEEPIQLYDVIPHFCVDKYGPVRATQMVLESGTERKQGQLLQELVRRIFQIGMDVEETKGIKDQIKKLSSVEGLIKHAFAQNLQVIQDIGSLLFLMHLGADINVSCVCEEYKDMQELKGFKQNTVICSVSLGCECSLGVPVLLQNGADPNVICCNENDVWPLFILKYTVLTPTEESYLIQCMLDAGLDRKRKFPRMVKKPREIVYESFDEILENDINAVKNKPIGTDPPTLPAPFVWDVIQKNI